MSSADDQPTRRPLTHPMDAAPLLSMRGMTKTFPGVTALEGVDLTVRAGTVHALCGENGAGKSTLMNVLAGLVQPDAGEVRLAGEPVRFSSPAEGIAAGISMIQQELHPVPARSVMENIWLGRFPRGRFGLVDHDRMRRDPGGCSATSGWTSTPMPRRVTCRSPRSS